MRYYVLASGSKGNSTLIISHGHKIIIDNGLSGRRFKGLLAQVNTTVEEIEAVLVTHNHADHISGLNIFNPGLIHCTKPTYTCSKENIIHPDKEYEIASFAVKVVPISHDAPEPVGFIIDDGEERLVYMTDTGYVPEKVLYELKDADYYIFESNHDPRMQLNTGRPPYLISRIMGDRGHLSNEDSALYLSEIISSNTKEITLAHLSQEANNEETALETFHHIMSLRGVDVSNINVRCAKQNEMVKGGQFDLV